MASSISKAYSTVLVTGATGFVASHVVLLLLQEGYTVRGIVRIGKADVLRKTYPDAGHKLEVTEVDDLTKDDLKGAMFGGDALIHVASPSPLTSAAQSIVQGSIDCTRNVLEAALSVGVKKVVCTSSVAALLGLNTDILWTDIVINEDVWPNVPEASALESDLTNTQAYLIGKTLAEKYVWEYAEKYPEVDFTTVVPPTILGPYVPHYQLSEDVSKLGTPGLAYGIVNVQYAQTLNFIGPHFVDVRDVAKIHVRALDVGLVTVLGTSTPIRKRLLVSGGVFTWHEAVDYLRKERSDLADRVVKEEDLPPTKSIYARYDASLTERVLRFGPTEWISWKDCLKANVDSLLEWEAKLHKV